jgi:DNA-binding NarL/FixJ family response regulator
MTPAGLLPTVRKLLDAATDADKWLPFLQELAACFRAKGAHIVRVQAQEKALAFSALYGFDDVIGRLYDADGAGPVMAMSRFGDHFASLMPHDPRIVMAERYPARPLSCRAVMSEAMLHESEVYKQLLDLADVEYSLVVNLPEENGSCTMMGVFRGKAGAPFSDADVEQFGELIPFVRHAVTISEQLASIDVQRSWALAALDSIPIGILLATGDARIVQANAAARQILGLRDGIVAQHGIIRLDSKAEERLLHLAIRKAVARAVHAGVDRSDSDAAAAAFTVTRPSGGESFSAIVSALADHRGRFGLSRLAEPLATVFLGNPEQPLEAPAELLERLFGLTAAQARLCELLVAGWSVEEAASRLQVSVATARVHLKRVFENVGVHKQSELIAKILATPIWMSRVGKHAPSRPGMVPPLAPMDRVLDRLQASDPPGLTP